MSAFPLEIDISYRVDKAKKEFPIEKSGIIIPLKRSLLL